MEQVKKFRAEVVKDHNGERDVLRIVTRTLDEKELVFFLKRAWKSHKKDGMASLLRHGVVWSISRREWENCRALESAGLKTAELAAYGEECSALWEEFSFILTEAIRDQPTIEEFLRGCRDAVVRRRTFDALAREIKRMHDAGLATPDLFTRHIFVDLTQAVPQFRFIDMARMDHAIKISRRLRVRDLAALNITSPLRFVTARERVRFLKVYAGTADKEFVQSIRQRTKYLLKRSKFQDFLTEGRSRAS